jgi:hypothetical protein
MSGNVEPAYVLARKVLLDALDALRAHRDALILVGAQTIYLHTGASDFALAPFTTDADLAINPTALQPNPKIAEALKDAGFFSTPDNIGIWTSATESVNTDLLVPEAVAGKGSRSADLGDHGNRVARRVRGLEPALVDNSWMRIDALALNDQRIHDIRVAGPAALLIAKLHKVYERKEQPTRLESKDAFDIYRLLQAAQTADLATTVRSLNADVISHDSTVSGMTYLRELFSTANALGARLAGQAVEGIADPDVVAASSSVLANDLLREVSDIIAV